MKSVKYKAILYIVFSAFSFCLMNIFVRLSGDLPSVQKCFFRNLVALFVAIAVLVKQKQKFTFNIKSLPFLILRSIFGTMGILFNFYAVDHLLLSNASMLNKMSPFFVLIFSYFILKEDLTIFQIGCVVTAFIGSLFIVKPVLSNLALVPSLAGLAGGICAGLAYAMVRILGIRGEKGTVIVLFFSAFSCLAVLPYMILNYTPMSAYQICMLLLAGVGATGGQFGITAAYTHAPAREVSIFDYSQIIFAAILGFLLFGDVPDVYSYIGYALIIGAAAAIFVYNNRKTTNQQ